MELTPRVGDRVLVDSAEALTERFAVGTVVDRADGGWWVTLDRREHVGAVAFRHEEITVVDREPVEWPEGWKHRNDRKVIYRPTTHVFTRYELEQILATGPDMLARWDELMGES